MTRLPTPPRGRPAVIDWTGDHLGGLFVGPAAASPGFVGGQEAANERLAGFVVAGYAAGRNEVWPEARRGASRLSPYIRHGLLSLPRVWKHASDGPGRDVAKFRDELLWQEYARHLYARLGSANREGLRARLGGSQGSDPWAGSMACVRLAVDELERDGWVVNQARMWLASHWAVREGVDWREGEDRFFSNLLDGSRAANRLGWQWTVGTGTGRPYGFSRRQVERRAPGLCGTCEHQFDCPIEAWPPDPPLHPVDPHPLLKHDPAVDRTAGPATVVFRAPADCVWLTAESMGDDDPALAANPDLPVVFIFDEPLLRRLRLAGRRLVFLAETLADLAGRRTVEVHRGTPELVLAGRAVATTFAPVPGWRRRAARIQPSELHPWPWLRPPHSGSLASFSAWRRSL